MDAMISDSIRNARVPSSKDFSKKKRTNRSAKLKQCKLDARREQWLSQVAMKNKVSKEEMNADLKISREKRESDSSFENLEVRGRDENNGGSINQEIFFMSPSNSPVSSHMGSTDSSPNFTGSSNSSSSSSSSNGCFSGNITEEEEDDGCLDDWEAIADALAATDDKPQTNVRLDPSPNKSSPTNGKKDCSSTRAWRPDDEYRPQGLPNLSKQWTFPDRHHGHGLVVKKDDMYVPSTCPICCEDLDFTDVSFLPCPCGYHLCLFCHKRILEENGRCPSCRKPYEKDMINPVSTGRRYTRSCSMVTKS